MQAPSDPEFERERELFLAALEHPSTAERSAFLDAACGSDRSMRARLDKMLGHHANDSFLEVSAAEFLRQEFPADKPGTLIGRYRILEQIGEGGMGVVHLAEQEEPVRRHVALKVIKIGMDTRSVVARFEAERQALALMDHPCIARVLDGGATAAGRPYFVMELVRGVPITQFCAKTKLSAKECLRLFIQVCHAVQHAHQKGIIHRDIKPSNILVLLHDGRPVPKIIDFGIAKATNQKLTEKTLFTSFATMIGTPAYMSPEQAEMNELDIDTRTDIYALGVLLYELLTGTTPFPQKHLSSVSFGEMQRIIREEEPEPPSTRRMTQYQSGVSGLERSEVHASKFEIDADLDSIVMKALEKDRARRYETASDLGADITRYLESEPVVARPPSAGYRFRKLVRRNRVAFAAAGAVGLALVLGTSVSTWQALAAIRARKVAEGARAAETRERSIAIVERNRALAEAARAEKAQWTAERNAYAATMVSAQADWDNANLAHLSELLDETRQYPEKGFEWYYWQRMIRSELLTMREHAAAVTAVCFDPHGSRIASGSRDRTVRIWDAASGQGALSMHARLGDVASIAFSTDGRRLITVLNCGLVRVFDSASGIDLKLFTGRAAALTPDGKSLLIASTDGLVRLIDLASERELWHLEEPEAAIHTLHFSIDGTRILATLLGGSLRMWKWEHVSKPALLWEQMGPSWERTTEARPAAISSDGRHVVIGGRDRIVRMLDANTGRETKSFVGHAEQVTAVAISLDGRRIASGGRDRIVKVWNVDEAEASLTLRGHLAPVLSLAFEPNGRRLASAGEDRTVKIWDTSGPKYPRVAGRAPSLAGFTRFAPTRPEHRNWDTFSTNALQLVRFSPDGLHLLTASKDYLARIWDVQTLAELRVLHGHTYVLSHANFSPDGRFVSTGSHHPDGSFRLWSASSGEELRAWRGDWGHTFWSKITRDGTKMLTTMADGRIRIWDIASGKELRSWLAHEGGTWTAEYSPDGERIASCGAGGGVKIWDARTSQELMSLHGHAGVVTPLVFSPDGKRLATGAVDRTLRVWSVSDGREELTIRGHFGSVNDVNFSPDGRRLVSAAHDKTVRLWDAINGRELLTVRGNSDYHMAAAFSPDGNRLACAGDFPNVELWEAANEDQVNQWRDQEDRAAKAGADWDRQAKDRESAVHRSFMRSWLIAAPISDHTGKSLLELLREEGLPDEARLTPRIDGSSREGSSELSWEFAHFEDGIIDFTRLAGDGEPRRCIAYAVSYVTSAEPRRGICLKLSGDGAFRVYVNGQSLRDSAVSHGARIDEDTVLNVHLEKGLNVVVLKVINDRRPWRGSVRFADSEDNPVVDLVCDSSPSKTAGLK